jgi:hypothetical protein
VPHTPRRQSRCRGHQNTNHCSTSGCRQTGVAAAPVHVPSRTYCTRKTNHTHRPRAPSTATTKVRPPDSNPSLPSHHSSTAALYDIHAQLQSHTCKGTTNSPRTCHSRRPISTSTHYLPLATVTHVAQAYANPLHQHEHWEAGITSARKHATRDARFTSGFTAATATAAAATTRQRPQPTHSSAAEAACSAGAAPTSHPKRRVHTQRSAKHAAGISPMDLSGLIAR